jgi:hypothetical protein
MATMSTARLLCGLAVLVPVVLALQPIQAAAQAQLAPVQRVPLRPVVWRSPMSSMTGPTYLSCPSSGSALWRGSMCAAQIWRLSIPAPARCLRWPNVCNALRNSPATSRHRRPQRCHRARTSAGHQTYGRAFPTMA